MGCDLFVDLADLIDVGAEITRLTRENEKTAGFIAAKQAKLADAKFAAKAPPAVVAKEREQLADLEAKLAKGMAALAELRARG
jgi:valyl-tRNA synthetase